jgi:hypothetical protein
MRVFARWIKHPLNVSVGRPVELDDQEQSFYRGLPLLEILLGLRKLLELVRGVLDGNELVTAGQRNRLVECSGP